MKCYQKWRIRRSVRFRIRVRCYSDRHNTSLLTNGKTMPLYFFGQAQLPSSCLPAQIEQEWNAVKWLEINARFSSNFLQCRVHIIVHVVMFQIHRVLLPRNKRENVVRRSIAYFVYADREEIINKPLYYENDVEKAQKHSAAFQPITSYEHVRRRWDDTY